MSQLCITVVGRTVEAIRQARIAAEADADLVELRLDSMDRPDAAAALAGRTKPAIVTCRPLREGGMFGGSEEDRLRVLDDAHAHAAEFIDVEWDAVTAPVVQARRGRGIIVSRHVFDAMPADAPSIVDHLRRQGAEVAKFAATCERLEDLRTLLGAARPDRSDIVIGMGAGGVATRVLASRFGSRWTYAGQAIAPGQIPASRLLDEFRFRRIKPDAAVYGVLGSPVTNSFSPAMHNAGFAALGLNAAYVPLQTRDLDGLRELAQEIGLRGLSVTIPFKQAVMPLLDEVAPAAASVGAANTVVIRGGRWRGSNTDGDGFLEPLRVRGVELRGLRAVILGAGGAARGVGLALQREGTRVAIAARREEQAREVARAVGAEVTSWPPPAGSWDLLVNATPVGSRSLPGTPFDGPFDGRIVYDLLYDPDPTALTEAAAVAGLQTIGGLAMLVAQAERQFDTWTGQRPPAGLFADAAASALRKRQQEPIA
jgi:3-dehydroquinate dehydratase/shikimate dehydrogenase